MGLLGAIFRGLFSSGRRSGLRTRTYNGYKQYQKRDGSWEFTHRRVAEKKLGGKIFDGIVIHHKDGNKKNNKPSNLWAMPRAKHSSLHAKKQSIWDY
jgi:hypothetical protein